jgi:succinate dehydrogenase / fumarate reductase cytochrome b subunit
MTFQGTGKDWSVRLRLLHAVTGVVPLGAFLVLHLWVQARAVHGPTEYARVIRKAESVPGLWVFEILGIYAPLLFHAAYGIFLSVRAASERAARPPRDAWSRPLQIASGIATLLFVAYHGWELPIARMLGRLRYADFFSVLVDRLSSTNDFGVPLHAMAYLLGLGASSYHFANGLNGFLLDFRVVTSGTTRRASVVCTIAGIVVFLLGARSVIYLATGAAVP